MRVLLFLAILGVVAGGVTLATDDPAGSAFQAAAGEVGLRVFGLILWAAAITLGHRCGVHLGVVHDEVDDLERRRNLLTVAFIALTAGVFVVIEETPVTLLIAGTFNGLILPIGFVLQRVAWRLRDLLGGYRYPAWLLGRGRGGGRSRHDALPRLQRDPHAGGPAGRPVDLNSDVGESFGRWTLGDDDAVLREVTSANVACGFHAGDPSTLRRTCAIAVREGVVIGPRSATTTWPGSAAGSST